MLFRSKRLGITYPVVVDSNFKIADAYGNRFWPRKFLIDRRGRIRFDHTGEGAYVVMERTIQELLHELHPRIKFPAPMAPLEPTDRDGVVCYPVTPELYLGQERGRLDNPEATKSTDPVMFTAPKQPASDSVYAVGQWANQSEYLRHTRDTEVYEDFLALNYRATEVNVVMKPEDVYWMKILVKQDEQPLRREVAGADVLFYSDWGDRHRSFNGRKVYYTGENMLPDYEECDFAFTSSLHPGDPRHHRLPYYACSLGDPAALIRRSDFDPEQILRSKTGFCCFVASNPRSPERNRFFRILNRRLRVDSGGRHFNNVGGPVKDKNAFLRSHKFTIAFENTAHPGYTTEKIVDAMLADSVPIYWGNPEVSRDFNTDSFIDASRFRSLEALADHVIEVHADDALYLRYLRQIGRAHV